MVSSSYAQLNKQNLEGEKFYFVRCRVATEMAAQRAPLQSHTGDEYHRHQTADGGDRSIASAITGILRALAHQELSCMNIVTGPRIRGSSATLGTAANFERAEARLL
jgi:hypothetical protein